MSAASACQGDGVVWGLCALPPPIRVATMNKDTMNKDTLLQRADDLEISLQRRQASLRCGGQQLQLSDRVLAVLHAFSTPRTLDAGLAELAETAQGRWDWLGLAGDARALLQVGALHPVDGTQVLLPTHPGRFDAADVHIRMLEDVPRTLAYREALQRCIRPDDIVVDVGTGTGVLAALAAQAGAAQVYAIERSPNTAKLAKAFFAANGLADRITVIEGDSTEISLPQKARVMVSEIIGNDPLDEGIIRTTQDAIARLLEPNPRLIPGRLQIFALPLQVPDKVRDLHFFSADHIERWREQYGLDFSVYRQAGKRQAGQVAVHTQNVRDWPRLCEPVLLADLDLRACRTEVLATTQAFRVGESGMLGGVLVYFQMDMGAGLTYSIHPDLAHKTNHWASKLWLPAERIPMAEGETWDIAWRFDRATRSQFEFQRVADAG